MSLLPINIPAGFTLTVKSGDILISGQVIAKRSEDFREIRIPLASLLTVSPKIAEKCLRKNPGDIVRVGEVIAAKFSFITSTEVVSTISGTILRFDLESGDIVIEKSGEDKVGTDTEIISPFDGVVGEYQENKVMLTTKEGGLIGLRGTGGNARGKLILAKSEDQKPVEGADITVEMIGNIALGKFFTKEALVKASGMEVSGVISLKINDDDIAILEQKRMLMPILEVDDLTWQALAKQIGKNVYLDSVAKTILIS